MHGFPIDMDADPGQNLAWIDGLGDVIDPADLKAAQFVLDCSERTQKDDRDRRRLRVLLQSFAGLETIHFGANKN